MPVIKGANGIVLVFADRKALLAEAVATSPTTGGGTTAPVVSVTAITLSPASGTANSNAGTVIGSLAATVTNGPLVSPVWALTSTAGGDFQIVNGNQVAVLPGNVPAGSYSITAQVSASNLATPFSQAVSVMMGAAQSTTPPVTTPIPSGGTSSGAPAALSDILWHSPEPMDPHSDDYALAGWGEPVGGIGPFFWSTPDAGNFACFAAYEKRGLVRVFGGMPASPTFRLTCTDGRGATVTKTCTVNVGTTSPLISCNDINPNSNCTLDTFYGGPAFRPTAPGVSPASFTVTNPDGSPTVNGFHEDYAVRWYKTGAQVIPPGSYPLLLSTVINGATYTHPFTPIITAMPTTGYIEFIPVGVSTATVVGSVIGKACATTPQNQPQFAINDGGAGVLAINNSTGEVRLISVPAQAGNVSFAITVTDQSYTYTQQFVLPITQGTVLSADRMNLALNPMTDYSFRAEYNQRPLGTPTVTGFPDPSKIVWSISDYERRNWMMDNPKSPLLAEDDDYRGGIGRPRFGVDPSTGAVVVQAHLQAPGEWFNLTATDGVRVCTKRIDVPVTATVGPQYYVGPNAAPAGMTKKASLTEALSGLIGWPPETDITGLAGLQVSVEYDPANPNRYVNDWEQGYYTVKRGYNGPFSIIGIPGPAGDLPFIGAPRGSSNVGVGDQGLFYCNDGSVRFENLELGFIHMAIFSAAYVPGSNRTMSLIRRAGGRSGDVTIRNCDLHDADVPIEAGNSDGYWTLDHVRITNGSGCSSQGGANQHNAYLGMIAQITATDCLFHNCADGHVFKTRAKKGTWTRCRFYDGERGSQFNALDLPCAGDHTMSYCHFEKGPAAQNPYMIQYGEELPGQNAWNVAAQDYVNRLSLDHCTFTNHATRPVWATGEHGPAMLNFVGIIAPNTGVPATLSITNSTFEGYAPNEVVVFSSVLSPSHDFSANYTQSGNTFTSTSYTPLDLTSPVSKDLGRPGWHDSVADLNGGKNFPYFNAVQMDPGTDEIRIPANSAPGAVICPAMRAYGTPNWSLSGNPQPDPRIAPFIAGTQWSNGTRLVDYTGVSFNYANSHYDIVTNSDGTATLKVGSAGLSGAGCDVILVRATSPSSTGSVIVEIPLFVVKT